MAQLLLIWLVRILRWRRRVTGQQAARLEPDQLCGDDHELGEIGGIDRVPRQVLEIGIGDLGERHAQDVELLRFDEVQQQLQWSLEDRKAQLENGVADRQRAGRFGHDGDRFERHRLSLPRRPHATPTPGVDRRRPLTL